MPKTIAERFWIDALDKSFNSIAFNPPMVPPMYDLTEKTWHKGNFYNHDGTKMCLSYALMGGRVSRDYLTDEEKKRAKVLSQVIQEHFPERVTLSVKYHDHMRTITYFNDHADTVFADVEKVWTEFKRRLEFEA